MQPFVRLHVLFFEFLLGSFSRTLLPMYPSVHTPHTRTHLHTHHHHHHHLTSSASPLPLSFFYFMDANRAGSSLPQRELRAPGCPRLLPAVSAATSSASLLISSATTDPPSLSHPCPCENLSYRLCPLSSMSWSPVGSLGRCYQACVSFPSHSGPASAVACI